MIKMKIITKKFKKKLLGLTLNELRDRELMDELEEIKLIISDIFNLFKIKARPLALQNKNENTRMPKM